MSSNIDNFKLYYSKKQQLRKMIIKNDHLFIEHYKEDTVFIIKTIKSLTQSGIENYTNLADYWMKITNQVNCPKREKQYLICFLSLR